MRRYSAWLFLLLAYGAYMMVWISTPLASLSFNAYDLADWMTVYPATPNRPDSFMVSMGLRILPILLIWAGCFYIQRLKGLYQFIGALVILVLMVSVAPPPELLIERSPDQIQRLQLFIVMLIGSGVIISGLLNSFRKWCLIGIGLIGAVCSLWSVLQVQTLFIDNSMPVSIGLSAFLFPILLALSIGLNLKWQS
jgi:hypothetical protein